MPLGRQKVVVAVRDEAEETAAEPAVGGDRDAGEAVRRFDLQHVAHSRLGPEDRGIDDEALLEPLHSVHVQSRNIKQYKCSMRTVFSITQHARH